MGTSTKILILLAFLVLLALFGCTLKAESSSDNLDQPENQSVILEDLGEDSNQLALNESSDKLMPPPFPE